MEKGGNMPKVSCVACKTKITGQARRGHMKSKHPEFYEFIDGDNRTGRGALHGPEVEELHAEFLKKSAPKRRRRSTPQARRTRTSVPSIHGAQAKPETIDAVILGFFPKGVTIRKNDDFTALNDLGLALEKAQNQLI